MRAVQLAATGTAGQGAWSVPRVFWIVLPRSQARDLFLLAGAPDNPFDPVPDGPAPSMVVPDGEVDVAVDGTAFLAAKAAALRAHLTQVEVVEPYFALSNRIRQPIAAVEYFRLVDGVPLPVRARYVDDLFADLPARP
jgi:N-acetyl-1-D-myo-inositol-2-amino-2-deoxy-alpha-D-glucopyranoside deacetylase